MEGGTLAETAMILAMAGGLWSVVLRISKADGRRPTKLRSVPVGREARMTRENAPTFFRCTEPDTVPGLFNHLSYHGTPPHS